MDLRKGRLQSIFSIAEIHQRLSFSQLGVPVESNIKFLSLYAMFSFSAQVQNWNNGICGVTLTKLFLTLRPLSPAWILKQNWNSKLVIKSTPVMTNSTH